MKTNANPFFPNTNTNTNTNVMSTITTTCSISDNIVNKEDDANEQILISIERLKKLELLEKSLPEMIDQAIQQHKKEKLKMLHEKDKQNPTAVNLRVKRYNEKHKEEINARRRLKKMEGKIQKGNSVVESLNSLQTNNIEINKQKTIVANVATDKNLTVRFDL